MAVGTTSLRSLESLYWTALRLKNKPDSEWKVQVSQWEPYESGNLPDPFQKLMAWLAEGMRQRGIQTLTGSTGLLIAPGYSLKVAEGLITNFHQPNSTLLLLVASVIGDDWKKVYRHALENGYRFLSYGDASLLEKK
jgi:S-adenosylmethionine:tRNA ribosyltransferase-isomerase